jgi:hypothetical protein
MTIEQISAVTRITVLTLAVLCAGTAEAQDVVRLSEPVESTDSYEIFGEAMPESEQSYTVAEAIDAYGDVSGAEITVTGTITEVCQQKGCWMIVTHGGRTARVTFKGYSFFVPGDSAGKAVRLSGILREVELTEDEARHFADDARPGSGAMIHGPQKEYSIEASSVQIFTN